MFIIKLTKVASVVTPVFRVSSEEIPRVQDCRCTRARWLALAISLASAPVTDRVEGKLAAGPIHGIFPEAPRSLRQSGTKFSGSVPGRCPAPVPGTHKWVSVMHESRVPGNYAARRVVRAVAKAHVNHDLRRQRRSFARLIICTLG